jgi:hypothetical protein
VKNLWAVEWLRWPGYGQFWGQLVREHMRQKRRQQLDLRAEIDPATGMVKASLDAIGGDDKFQNGLEGKLTVRGPEGSGWSGAPHPLDLPQTAPGRYEREFLLDRYGPYLLHASLEKAVDDGKGGTHSVAIAEGYGHVTNPYPREYLAIEPDTASLRRVAEATGGSMDPDAKKVWDAAGETVTYHEDLWPRFISAAIVLFVIDLLLRRVRLFDRKKTTRPPTPKWGRGLAVKS